jgi:hypothetical protein
MMIFWLDGHAVQIERNHLFARRGLLLLLLHEVMLFHRDHFRLFRKLLLLLLMLVRHAPLLDQSVFLSLVDVKRFLARAHFAAQVTLELDAVDDQMSEMEEKKDS